MAHYLMTTRVFSILQIITKLRGSVRALRRFENATANLYLHLHLIEYLRPDTA
jgi:hypothetical protein